MCAIIRIRTAPSITITDAAAEALREAARDAEPGQRLHLGVSARHQSSLFLAPVGEREVEVESNGVTLCLDALSAARAVDASIDITNTPRGNAFQVSLPHAPSVQPMDVGELKRRLDAGEGMELLDVRTPEERETAQIPGAVMLDQPEIDRVESLPRDTTLVFHCHHGGRSQSAAAEQCSSMVATKSPEAASTPRRRRAGTAGFVVVAGADKKARRSRDRQLVAKSGGQSERGGMTGIGA